MALHNISIVKVTTPNLLEQCYALRVAVFVEEQQVPPWEELDAYDAEADHYVALVGGTVVGTLRLVRLEGGVGKVGRVAVDRAWRGKGVGTLLMTTIIEQARSKPADFGTLLLDAQILVIPFYETLGFVAEGDVFLDSGIEHRKMRLEVSS